MSIHRRRWAYGLLLAMAAIGQAVAAGFGSRSLNLAAIALEVVILGVWAVDEQRQRRSRLRDRQLTSDETRAPIVPTHDE